MTWMETGRVIARVSPCQTRCLLPCTSKWFVCVRDACAVVHASHPMAPASAQLSEWPEYSSYRNTSNYPAFWRHEWTKHGTCASAFMPSLLPTPLTFFKTVLGFHRQHDLTSVLRDSNFIPRQAPYASVDLLGVLQRRFGVTGQLRCNGPDNAWLSTIFLCYSTNLTLINCPDVNFSASPFNPPVQDAQCGESFILPATHHYQG